MAGRNRYRDPRTLLKRLVRREDGGAFIEFAFIMPVVLVLMLGMLEVAMILLVSVLLDAGVRQSSRFGITGFTLGGQSREDQILAIIEDTTIGLVDMEEVQIDVLVYPSFIEVGQPEPYTDDMPANGQYDEGEEFTDINGNGSWDEDMGTSGAGGPGEVVVYSVRYDWPLLTGYLFDVFGAGGTVPLGASIAVRNEPF